MLIVHVVDPFAGGLVTFLKLLTEQLSDDYHIMIHGERRELMDPREVKKIFPKKNIRFLHWKSIQREIDPVKDLKSYLELVKILRHFKHADVVHLHSSKAGFLGRLACKRLGIKNVIYTPNGAPFLMNSIGRIKSAMFGRIEKLGNKMGGKVICTSPSEQKAYLDKGIDALCINNGTRIGKHSFIKEKNYQRFRIVTSGRLADQKNPVLFNEIANSFLELKHFEFIWIGDGEEREHLTSSNITITGWLSEKGVKNEIAKADLYMSTSYFEGLPFAVIEAMGMGKCLLLSNCIGNIDLVQKGINGEMFDTKEEAVDLLLYFFLNREITESMGLNSLEICRDYFNIEETALRYRLEYQKLNGAMMTKDALNEVFLNAPSLNSAFNLIEG